MIRFSKPTAPGLAFFCKAGGSFFLFSFQRKALNPMFLRLSHKEGGIEADIRNISADLSYL